MGDKVAWIKRVNDVSMLFKAEAEIKANIASCGLNWAKARKLRLV